MKERLVIKNFGPIKSVDLDLGKMTILIGDNATGKSTIAKVLAICRYFSYLVDTSYKIGYDDSFDKGLRYWGIFAHLNEDSIIEYQCKDYRIKIAYAIKDWEYDTDDEGNPIGEGFPIYAGAEVKFEFQSENFKNLLVKLEELQPWKEKEMKNPFGISSEWWSWQPSSNFFEIDVKKVMNNPFYFPTERGLQSIFSIGRSKSASDSLYEQLADLSSIVSNFKSDIKIETFDIYYQNSEGRGLVRTKKDKDYYSLNSSASGYQTAIPIILTLKYYTEIERRYSRTYIIEEPETNLFPTRQKKLLEFLVVSINKHNNQFLLPTHSPYILSSLNNLMYAYKVANEFQAESEVEKIIPKEFWMNPKDVEVYFLENGNSKSLINKKEGLINIDELDGVSEIINKEFDDLLAIEIKSTEHDKV